MSKVKIQGHASGTGVFTLTSPNSSTDRTITLPDADVTLGTDATKMPLSGGAFTGAVTTNSTFDGVDIATRDVVLTSTTTTANNALPKAGGTMTGDLLIHKQNPVITFKPTGANNAMKLMFKDENDDVKFTLGYQDSVSAFRLSSTDINATDYIHIKTDGNVGIGTSSPDEKLDVEGTIQISRTDGYTANWKQTITHASSSYNGTLYFTGSSSTGGVIFRPNGSPTVSFPVAGGITFGSDTATANALDDYEEGTWTPVYTVTGGGSHSSVSAGNAGTYTKIGRTVTIAIYSYVVQTTGTITGYNVSLPFAAGNYPSSGMGIEFGHSGHGQKLQINHNASTMNITKYDGSSPMGSAYFQIGVTYQTA